LSFYAVYQGLPYHWAAIVNKGVTTRESENSKAVDVNDIAQMRRWIKDDAEEWRRDLIKYLCSCSLYPLWVRGSWCGGGCGCDGKTNDVDFDSGIFIPKRK
jgi:hypothetical protein